MDVAVTGSSGLIGTALSRVLEAAGHTVVRVVRRPVGSAETALRWDPDAGTIDAAGLEGVAAVVHLAGAGIGDRRWTPERKREILESRTKGTALVATTLAGLSRPPEVLVSGSAIGFYGDRGDEVLTEQSPPATTSWPRSARRGRRRRHRPPTPGCGWPPSAPASCSAPRAAP